MKLMNQKNAKFRPQIRVYEDADGIFEELHTELIEQEIVRQRISSGEYFRNTVMCRPLHRGRGLKCE